jgi:RNA polymerase sigma-70 factor (ECF subfamily)
VLRRLDLVRQSYDGSSGGKVTVDENEWLAERFEAHRAHLQAVAYRMLGSRTEADDAVQESWLRLSRSDTSGVENLAGWLTTVVGRVCLDMLRSRKSRREDPLDEQVPESIASIDPEQEALQADSVGLALLVVLDTLTPAERLAFVLHDMFAVPFDEIAAVVGRSPAASKQLASRARRRVQGAKAQPDADLARQREVVAAFLAASRNGDFDALVAMLDPDVVLRADRAAVDLGAEEARGALAVAGTFSGRARAARLAVIDGAAGLVWASGGQPRVAFAFAVKDGTIVGIELFADPVRLGELDLVILDE